MANINEAFPSTYLKASDLHEQEVVVTIERITFEPVGRDREMKAIAHFKGKDKGLVLNKTNARKIAQLAGSEETDEWPGTKIKLYPTETEFGGETVECIRIKPAVTQKPLATRRPEPVESPAHRTGTDDDDIPF